MQQPPVRHYGAEPEPYPEGTERDGSHRASGFLPGGTVGRWIESSAPTAAPVTDQTTDHVQASDPYVISRRSTVGPTISSRKASRPPGCQGTSIYNRFTDHLCPPSLPLGHSTTLHLKFGTVSVHPQYRRTLSVVLGAA